MRRIGLTLCLLLGAFLSVAAQVSVKPYVEPLLKSAWGQGSPYNSQCPQKTNQQGDLQHCRVGCVACAMAQVLRFYEYPEVGIGQWTDIFNAAATANFGETHYDWSNMRDSYFSSYTDREAEAVATLMYHCGVAVNMIYGLESSATFTAFANNMTTALTTYFGYEKEGLQSVSRSKFTKTEWLQMIKENLSAGRPIIYSGSSPTMGGHTWVIDGYDSEGKVHINWGWNGQEDNYYDIDLTDTHNDFCKNQSMVIGIRPPLASGINVAGEREKPADGLFYNLQGQRMKLPLRPGIFIHNGKKIQINNK